MTKKFVTLPEVCAPTIVLITSDELRHRRFAYRMQQEFGSLVLAWYQVGAPPWFGNTGGVKGRILALVGKVAKLVLPIGNMSNILNYMKREGLSRSILRVLATIGTLFRIALYLHKARGKQDREERRVFGAEVAELEKYAKLKPVTITDANTPEFIEFVKRLSPYFLLSLGGDILGEKLIKSIRGVVINQHAGWSPTYKGTGTIWWALYHRDLNAVGCTVHLTTSGIDAGAILHKSQPCLMPDDSPESIFARVVALGTELMVDVVWDIIANPVISVDEELKGAGMTYLASQLTWDIREAIYRDFGGYWLAKEIARARSF